MTELQEKIETYRLVHAELTRLEALRTRKISERDQTKAKAEQLRQGMGERMLVAVLADDSEGESEAISEATAVSVKADALAQLVTALDAKIEAAKVPDWQAKANCLRAEAAQLLAEAAERQKVLDPLLTQLFELEGCTFGPVRIARPFADPKAQGGVITVVHQTQSKTEAMLARAKALEAAAKDVEKGWPVPHNIFDGTPTVVVPDYLAVPVPALAEEL